MGLFSRSRDNLRELLASLSPEVRLAWKWDMLTALLAGIYQGCIWTFVMRVARADLKATGEHIAWIAAAPALGYLFATVWARQMEGREKMPFVFWTWLAARGMFLFAPLIASRNHFVAMVCFTPLIFSVSTPAYTAIMKEIYPERQRGRLMSSVRIVMNGFTLGFALLMGALMDAGLDYRYAFCFGGFFGALSAWTFSRIRIPPVAEIGETRSSVREFYSGTLNILVRNPGYRWFSASVFVSGFGNIIAATLYPIYQVDRFHVSNTDVAALNNTQALCTMIGFFFWGGFLDRRGPLVAVLFALAANLLVPIMYAGAWGMSALFIASGLTGLAMAGVDLAYLNAILLFAEPGRVAQYQALHSSFFGIRGSIAPHFAIPLVHALGYQNTFLIAFGIMVGGVLLQLISMRDYRRTKDEG